MKNNGIDVPALAGIPPTTLPTVLLPYPQLGGSGSILCVVGGGFVRACSVVGTGRLLVRGQHTSGVVPAYPQTDFLKKLRVSGSPLLVLSNCTRGSQLFMLMQVPEVCSGVWHEEPSKISLKVLSPSSVDN